MNIPIPAETPDPNIDNPTLPPTEPEPIPEKEPPEHQPPPVEEPPRQCRRSLPAFFQSFEDCYMTDTEAKPI